MAENPRFFGISGAFRLKKPGKSRFGRPGTLGIGTFSTIPAAVV
jgi:hypothetical protein